MRWKIGRRGRGGGGGRGGGASSTSVSPDMTLRRAFLLLLLLLRHCRRRLQKGHIPSQAASPETFSLPFPAGDIESKLCPMCIVPRYGCDDDGLPPLSFRPARNGFCADVWRRRKNEFSGLGLHPNTFFTYRTCMRSLVCTRFFS